MGLSHQASVGAGAERPLQIHPPLGAVQVPAAAKPHRPLPGVAAAAPGQPLTQVSLIP